MSLNKKVIDRLAVAMLRPRPRSRRKGQSSVEAALTYIGQMISHDIVPPTKRLQISRKVTPELNLDSIYGEAPLYTFEFLPEATGLLNKKGHFYLGKNDLRRIDGKAIIPESRNDENAIVSQLHLFWQRLHNTLLLRNCASTALEARRMVTRLFQIVVIEDLLYQTLDRGVFNAYFRDNKTYLDSYDQSREVPAFFSRASFRYGHSVVRRSYRFKEAAPLNVSLKDLFTQNVPLPAKLEIDWAFFTAAERIKSAPFDTYITQLMSQIPLGSARINITLQNLLAGQAADLPAGIAFVEQLMAQDNARDIKDDLALTKLTSLAGSSFVGQVGVSIDNLPLWPYILLEAEQTRESNALGVLGSILNAEVLRRSIEKSDISVYEQSFYKPEQAREMLGEAGDAIFGQGKGFEKWRGSVLHRIASYVQENESVSS